MSPPSGRTLAVLAAVLLGLAGCDCGKGEPSGSGGGPAGEETPAPSRAAERVVLERVTVRTVAPEQAVDIFEDQLGSGLGARLVASEAFVASADEVPAGRQPRPAALRLTITYDLAPGESGTSVGIVCAVEAELEWLDGGVGLRLRENLLAERAPVEVAPGALPGLVATHIAAAVEAVADGLIAKELLRSGPDADIIAVLARASEGSTGSPPGDVDLDLVLWALELVGERGIGAAFEAVVALAESADPRIRHAVVGALVALGDPRGVDPLTRSVDFTDHDELRAVVEAVTAIGGDDAAVFLEFVASGHTDDDIKARAREGLERVHRGKDRGEEDPQRMQTR